MCVCRYVSAEYARVCAECVCVGGESGPGGGRISSHLTLSSVLGL